MYKIVFYEDRRGNEPAADWINHPENGNIRDSIDARIINLQNEGPDLPAEMLVPIRPRSKKEKRVPGFYELKHRGKKWRIAVYHDLQENRFVLLNGWHKSQRTQSRDIDEAYSFLYDYLSRKEGK